MIRKNSFYFTSELIENYSSLNGLDEGLVRDIYYYYIDVLRAHIKSTSNVAYLIKNLGTFYFTLTGANYEIRRNSRSKFFSDKRADTLLAKKTTIKNYINKLKEEGIKSIPYFKRIFNPKGIKNNEC